MKKITQAERQFLLFHHNPPPVTNYVVMPPENGKAQARLVAIKRHVDGSEEVSAIPFARYRALGPFFKDDMTVNLTALVQAGVVEDAEVVSVQGD